MVTKKKYPCLDNLTEKERLELENGLPIQHYAIFNNRVDHNLLELIHNGSEILTDNLFFELLNEDPAYLGTFALQKRICEWQDICEWEDLHTQNEVSNAKSNLLKIGRMLARSGKGVGAPESFHETYICSEYIKTENFLQAFFAKAGEEPSSRFLTETYPEFKKAFLTERGRHEHRTLREIALRLTQYRLSLRAKPVKISLKTLRQITK